jgi:hypothetical protein
MHMLLIQTYHISTIIIQDCTSISLHISIKLRLDSHNSTLLFMPILSWLVNWSNRVRQKTSGPKVTAHIFMQDIESRGQPLLTKRCHKKWRTSALWEDMKKMHMKWRATRMYFPIKCSWPHSTSTKHHFFYSTVWTWMFVLVKEEVLKYFLWWETRGSICAAIEAVFTQEIHELTLFTPSCLSLWQFTFMILL